METRFGVVLVAAGEGRRLGRPKALLDLGGIPLVERAAAPFAAFRDKVVVLRAEDLDACELKGWKKVAGGELRRDSVAAGLEALDPGTEVVLVHDAARALLPEPVLARILEAAATAPAVIPVVPLADTIKRVAGARVEGTVDRARLAGAQTPQAIRVDLLRRALNAVRGEATDEAALVEALNEPVVTVPGDPANFKITTPLDLELARLMA
ncbi:MAG: 2-C-methyl-D-erythritol 4-phosphate cytidylyltransferase [Planctomycetota bacterium]|jgi:2-C-methyl-D-erythritol 4-phosphate cytidylyltransferase